MTSTLGLERLAGRCAHGFHLELQGCSKCGVDLKFRTLAAVSSAAPADDRARIDAAIRDVAARGGVFSANDVRALVPDVSGPLMGARFNAAAKAGRIVHVGYERSTKASTHAHPIAQWRAAS